MNDQTIRLAKLRRAGFEADSIAGDLATFVEHADEADYNFPTPIFRQMIDVYSFLREFAMEALA